MRWGGLLYYAGPALLAIAAWLIGASLVADRIPPRHAGPTVLSRMLRGCAYLIVPILSISAFEIIRGSPNDLDGLLAHAVIVYLFVAVLGVPIVAVLRRVRIGSVIVLMVLTMGVVVSLLVVAFQLSEQRTAEWLGRSLLYWVPYSIAMAAVFGIGASLPLVQRSEAPGTG